ncbi:hypothetical protein GOODEAATRI_014295 [Goodea atripinnis]|uniref:RING-type domain-containing protein n=1 Tax=Goodea atripinnis TaxID=208336 RepID=A0ABV0NNN1_9TELE
MNTDFEEQEDELLALQSIFGSEEFLRHESNNQLTDLYQATGNTVVLFSWIQFLREDALKHLNIHTLLELPSDHSKILQTNQAQQEDECYKAEEKESTPQSEPSDDQNHHVSSNLSPPPGDAAQGSDFTASNTSETTDDFLSSAVDKFELSESVTDIPPNKDHSYSGLSLTPSQMLLSQILIYDAEQKRKVFASTLFDCGVCFTSWLGSECVQLYECGHIFCRACLSEFCKVQITEGTVQGVICPQPDCTATPTPAQTVFLLISEAMAALLRDYATGSRQRRRLLEGRYGRKLLLYTQEKHASDKWVTVNTKPCPHCFCPIQVHFVITC